MYLFVFLLSALFWVLELPHSNMPQLVHNESGEDGAEEGEDGVEGGDHATTRIPSAKGVTLKRQSTGHWTGFGLILQSFITW